MFIGESILLHPSIPASESKPSIYFFCDRKCSSWTWPPQCLRSTLEIKDPWSKSVSAITYTGCQSILRHLLWSQYHPYTQPTGSSSYNVSTKTQRNLYVSDKYQIHESLMQSAQTRLSETVSDRKVTSSICKHLHTPPEQQWRMVAPYKLPHQEYYWEMHSWCPTDEVASGMSLLMTQGSAQISSSRSGRRYIHNLVHTSVSISWQPIFSLSEPEAHIHTFRWFLLQKRALIRSMIWLFTVVTIDHKAISSSSSRTSSFAPSTTVTTKMSTSVASSPLDLPPLSC